MQEELNNNDHRKIAQELELYAISDSIGSGLIIWLPNGNIIKEQLENWGKDIENKNGYQRVSTPMITKESLFYKSEHLPHYKDSMFPPIEMDGENYYVKPMNCPFHHTIFSIRPRSYKELPLRIAEYGTCHRNESSGSLMGLMRVRAMTMNDAHIYCSLDQVKEEFKSLIELHKYYYSILGIKDYWIVLSLRNPENSKYHGNNEMWDKAESILKEVLIDSNINYKIENDGAAFYGPKLDFQIKSSIDKEFTLSTCQLDFFMPEKFDLKYINSNNENERPVCIHRSPLGTHERFIGFLIEHFEGKFPLWLSPEQVRILPVSNKFDDYANQVYKYLKNSVRVKIDNDNESLNKRIRNAELSKVPYIVVLGQKEIDNNSINVRDVRNKIQKEYSIEDFESLLRFRIENKLLD